MYTKIPITVVTTSSSNKIAYSLYVFSGSTGAFLPVDVVVQSMAFINSVLDSCGFRV